ncbi:hypothetical protein DRV85_06735 [Rhodosalinus halophilus]|uniref:Uncharacterized protein n=1 Tax=Rhodosalinus halophilus TaxID=2259333 RepID=A0A365U905_9RHOB|nr:hypothetical protein [Rhodosalinus halophilus]RBI85434.1 hypothetical protein DRV85_06735 [Rhodosalinus halophilus]
MSLPAGRFFVITAAGAVLLPGALVGGFELAGLPGALIAQGVGALLAYSVLVWRTRRQSVWDPADDAGLMSFGALFAAGAVWLDWPAVAALAGVAVTFYPTDSRLKIA